MKAVFTIVAKNYIPLAYTLKESIKKIHPDLEVFIFVTAYKNKIENLSKELISLEEIESLDLNISDMAFKYNITEFCTSIKPACFEWLYKKGYSQLIYFDPDIYVYNSLNEIFDHLNSNFLVITPHYCSNDANYKGVRSEGMILFSGVYNLGFCGVNLNKEGVEFISWWKEKLRTQCYADKTDGLHTDQKWIDLVHCIFDNKKIKVLKHPGSNAAIWNMHERTVHLIDEQWKIKFNGQKEEEDLIFYHFSSFDYYDNNKPNKLYPSYKEKFPNLIPLVEEYYKNLNKNNLDQHKGFAYDFNYFDNGDLINQMHRRLYRRMIDQNLLNSNSPFKTGSETFHELLKKNQLLTHSKVSLDSQNELKMTGFNQKVRFINKSMRLLKKILGFERYFLLMKFFQRYSRFENQSFLIKEFAKEYKFLNENR